MFVSILKGYKNIPVKYFTVFSIVTDMNAALTIALFVMHVTPVNLTVSKYF
jgi:hypothetical protein